MLLSNGNSRIYNISRLVKIKGRGKDIHLFQRIQKREIIPHPFSRDSGSKKKEFPLLRMPRLNSIFIKEERILLRKIIRIIKMDFTKLFSGLLNL